MSQQQPEPKKFNYPKPPKRERKEWDPMLDAWYYIYKNKRHNEDSEVFKNYQINPYTRKTLDYCTPKITDRRRPLPECPEDTERCRSFEDDAIVKNYKLVKCAVYKGVNPPRQKFTSPQTELMQLGWYDKPPPYRNPLQCMYIQTCWSDTPCCYFHPKCEEENEDYDPRFRAAHPTAEFIKTVRKLKAYDAIMNPNGFRGGPTKSTVTNKK